MRVEKFLAEHGLSSNPFDAEEARHDIVFERLIDSEPGHPDFTKILGRIDRPTTSVVFGEKGSGKTAIRLQITRRVEEHNAKCPANRILLVAYDQLNPMIDRVLGRIQTKTRHSSQAATTEQMLGEIRLEDHQDAILSLAVTQIVDGLLHVHTQDAKVKRKAKTNSRQQRSKIHKFARQTRVNLAIIAALYDQPPSGGIRRRWSKLCTTLRVHRLPWIAVVRVGAMVLTLLAAGLSVSALTITVKPVWLITIAAVTASGALLLWGLWLLKQLRIWQLVRNIRRETLSIDRSATDLRDMLTQIGRQDLAKQSWPCPGVDSRNSRYELTTQFVEVLNKLGYSGIMVLVDCVDEPTLISGYDERMRRLIWPMLDNKFLQQDRVGFKLLLPIELRQRMLHETAQFFQEARLDKQNLIDRLVWSGATLFDLCSHRLEACQVSPDSHNYAPQARSLMDLFGEDVSRDLIVDALDTMQQPRDAFKFLYTVILDHCRVVADDQPVYRIPRLIVEAARRQQVQRVQDFQRGLGPG